MAAAYRCPSGATATFSPDIPISYPRTSLRSHSGGVLKISFSPYPPDKNEKEKNPNPTKSDCSSPPGLLRGRLKPLLVLHLARILLLLGDRGLVLGALGLPPPWALRSFIALLLSCRSGSACWCPPAGPPWGVGAAGCGRSHVATTWPVIGGDWGITLHFVAAHT